MVSLIESRCQPSLWPMVTGATELRIAATPGRTNCETWLSGVVLDADTAKKGARIQQPRRHLDDLSGPLAKVSP
jgi:hypothetical protein